MISEEFSMFLGDDDLMIQYYVFVTRVKFPDYIGYKHKTTKGRHNVYGWSYLNYRYQSHIRIGYNLQDKSHRLHGPATIYIRPYEHRAVYKYMDKKNCLYGPAVITVKNNVELDWYINDCMTYVNGFAITEDALRSVYEIINLMNYIQPRLMQLLMFTV